MKQIYSKMLLLIAMILVGGSAWADDVTFTFKTDEDITYTKTGTSGGGAECIVSKDDVTLSGTDAYTNAGATLNVYKKSTLTITAPGNITNIALEYNGKVYPFDEAVGDGKKGEKFSASGAHPATYTPASSSTSVTLTNSNGGKTELLSLKVTYVAGTAVKVTGVSLDTTSKTLTEGEAFTLTATVAPADASNQLITWSSSDETVAKVDKEGEVVSVAPGTATITVKTVDGNYTASCAVTVKAAPEPDEYVFLFAPAGSDGDSSSSVSAANLNKTFAEGYEYISSITAERVYPARNSLGYGVKFGSSSSAGTITLNLKKPVKATYLVVSAAAYGDLEGQQGFTINGTSVDMSAAQNKIYSEYVIKLDGSDLSTIKLSQNVANKGRIYVEYIKVLKQTEEYTAVKTIGLFAKSDGVYYGTFSCSNNVYFPSNVFSTEKFYTATVENGSIELEELAEGSFAVPDGVTYGYYVPANTGVIVSSTLFKDGGFEFDGHNRIEYFECPNIDVDPLENNMLRPASEAMTGNCKFYKLAYDVYTTESKTDLGFYYGAEDGASFTCKAGTAYLAVPAESAVKSFALNPSATAIQSVNTTSSSSAIYNLNGQRLSQLQKGINIVDGKKLFVK